MSDIVLSAGVRQNLLALQNTAQLMSLTQNRLATGKKVNSALDNPSSFFTSQALSFRASDLNSLLDAIGQGQKILEAADKGLTSLTKLVESAKATARQARQAPQPQATYAAVNANSDISLPANLNGNEVIGTFTGNVGAPVNNLSAQAINLSFTNQAETLGQVDGAGLGATLGVGNGGNLVLSVGATDHTIALADGDDITAIVNKINAVTGASAANVIQASNNGGQLRLTALNADVDFTINATSTNATTTALGLTEGNSYNSTSLLDRVVAAGGTAGDTLAISVNGGTAQTVTFTTAAGANNVSTIAEFNAWLQGLTGGASGTISGTTFTLTNPAGNTNTLGLTVTGATNGVGIKTALGLTAARAAGQTGGLGTGTTRTFNSAATLADLDPTNLLAGGNLNITVNGSSQTVGLAAGDRLDDIITKLRANATLDNNLTFTNASGELQITAKNADVDFTINANNVSAALTLTTDNVTARTVNSTSLFDLLATKLGGVNAAQGSTLTVGVNGGAAQTLTFGTGATEISTLAELSTALTNLSGVSATLVGTALNLQVNSGNSPTSLTLGGTAITAFGLASGTTSGAQTLGANNAVRTNLQSDYNNILAQVDALVKDASYNGINLLNGDNLKIVFNENGTSSLTITGVTFDSAGLGLNTVAGTGFQNDAQIDTTLGQLDSALTTLRTQASKFGSSLTTVQVRQEFTKQMIATLQTGADQLVLADTNEEGANLLALQTRQQLSTTALSLSAQADQAVLRLFG
jgi:flagellin-like hook-associated protein FlgL